MKTFIIYNNYNSDVQISNEDAIVLTVFFLLWFILLAWLYLKD